MSLFKLLICTTHQGVNRSTHVNGYDEQTGEAARHLHKNKNNGPKIRRTAPIPPPIGGAVVGASADPETQRESRNTTIPETRESNSLPPL